MEIDLAKLKEGDLEAVAARLRSQVCIVGGGIAGLILAHRLAQTFTVTVLEAGGRERREDGADPFGAELRGVPHEGTRAGRVRAFGGTSLTWGGQLLALPEDATWPVSAAELRDHGQGWRMPHDVQAFLAERGAELPKLVADFPELTPRLSRFVPFSLRNLAKRPGRELLARPQVKVVVHAPVRALVLSSDGKHVSGVEVLTPQGRALRVEAEQYVVAAGTVETCRLLLASNIGKASGQVGRNFHDHLTVTAGVFSGEARERVLAALRPWVFGERRQLRAVYSLKLEASAGLRERLALPPAMAHVTVEEPEDSGVGALRAMLRGRQGGLRGGAKVGALPGMLAEGLRLAWEARVRKRRYVSPEAVVRLQVNMAQETPSPSRIGLSEDLDGNGMPKAVVDWRVSEGELAALRRFVAYLKGQLAAAGLREGVAWEPALLGEGAAADEALLARLDDARHAMGGASMGTDPQTSVVDPELRVHGVANLSVASAAVFPDGSAQLPTLTLSALCVRLAERLAQELR